MHLNLRLRRDERSERERVAEAAMHVSRAFEQTQSLTDIYDTLRAMQVEGIGIIGNSPGEGGQVAAYQPSDIELLIRGETDTKYPGVTSRFGIRDAAQGISFSGRTKNADRAKQSVRRAAQAIEQIFRDAQTLEQYTDAVKALHETGIAVLGNPDEDGQTALYTSADLLLATDQVINGHETAMTSRFGMREALARILDAERAEKHHRK